MPAPRLLQRLGDLPAKEGQIEAGEIVRGVRELRESLGEKADTSRRLVLNCGLVAARGDLDEPLKDLACRPFLLEPGFLPHFVGLEMATSVEKLAAPREPGRRLAGQFHRVGADSGPPSHRA